MDRFINEETTESSYRMSTSTKRVFSPDKLAGAAISLIVVVGLIHLIDAPGDLQEAPYQGLLFLANFFGALAAAIGIQRGHRWGWLLGVLVAGGAFVGYVISRTVGLPGFAGRGGVARAAGAALPGCRGSICGTFPDHLCSSRNGGKDGLICGRQHHAPGVPKDETEQFMKRLMYMAALALVATLVLAPGAMALQMNGEHMMPNGQMMASPSATASATPSATDNGQMMNGNMMASPSASASASPSATPTASATATASTMASAPRSHHHGGDGSSVSAAVGGRLPSTGDVPWVSLASVGALVSLMGFGLVAYRLLRRST